MKVSGAQVKCPDCCRVSFPHDACILINTYVVAVASLRVAAKNLQCFPQRVQFLLVVRDDDSVDNAIRLGVTIGVQFSVEVAGIAACR